ncbi:MAG: hypothetical protein HY460_00660 [Parcubacteria group bacterium]|nr:hypothetical protein [Parcubacteria group bacterium]
MVTLAAVLGLVILFFEATRSGRVTGSVDVRFLPESSQSPQDISAALLSSREIAERSEAWFRDRSFVRRVEQEAGTHLSRSSWLLPSVSAMMPNPETLRLTVHANAESDIERFFNTARAILADELTRYGTSGVTFEIAPPVYQEEPRIRLLTVWGIILLALIGAAGYEVFAAEMQGTGADV